MHASQQTFPSEKTSSLSLRPSSTGRRTIAVGDPLPSARLGLVENGVLTTVSLSALLHGHRALIIGFPGAFTPVCSRVQLPRYVEMAADLRASGYSVIIGISGDNPWVMDAFADRIDPERRLHFLSDGNLEFARACGLTSCVGHLFLGECVRRFSMVVQAGKVAKLGVEDSILDVCETAAEAFLG